MPVTIVPKQDLVVPAVYLAQTKFRAGAFEDTLKPALGFADEG
jgi:hypothetical protein